MEKSMSMGVGSLQGTNFQRNYLWDIILPDMGAVSGFDLGRYVQNVAFGDYEMDAPAVMRVGPYQAYFASLLTVQQIKMTILKGSPDFVAPYLYTWKQLMVDNSGLFQPKKNYQRNIYIRFLDQTGNVTEQYKCIGCFPTAFPQYPLLDYTTNKIAEIPLVFNVDKIEYSNNLT